jgi:hypothetical protein
MGWIPAKIFKSDRILRFGLILTAHYISPNQQISNMADIVPPWTEFPNSDPTWCGWRQGDSERWLLDIWLPFWKSQDSSSRERV